MCNPEQLSDALRYLQRMRSEYVHYLRYAHRLLPYTEEQQERRVWLEDTSEAATKYSGVYNGPENMLRRAWLDAAEATAKYDGAESMLLRLHPELKAIIVKRR